MSAVDLSIVVVAYNAADLLRATLESVVRHTRAVSYEIIVIDSASTEDIAAVVDRIPGARLIRSARNQGFAAANNRGLRASAGRYVALLNPDVLLHDDALSALVRWLDDHPQAGGAGPQLVRPDGSPQPYSHGSFPSPWYLLRRRLARLRGGYLHPWGGSAPVRAEWLAGTCLVARRSALQAVHGLDDRYFLYFEDVDLGRRLTRAGWPLWFVPDVRVTHIGGGSVGAHGSPHYDRSLVRLYATWYGGPAAVIVWLGLRLYRRLLTIIRA